MKNLIFILLGLSFGQVSDAQCILGDAVKAELVKEWEMAKVMTNEYLNTMPADKYDFKVQDSIRSFAQQMLHLAQVNNAMISHGTGAARIFSPARRLEQIPSAHTKDSVVYYVNAELRFCY